MPRSGSGAYTIPTSLVAGDTARASDLNGNFTDLGAEISDSLSRSGKGGMSAALDMNSNKITELAAPTAASDAATKAYADSAAAPDAEYIVGAVHAGLSAERLVTNTASVSWDLGTAGQAKANVVDGGISTAKLAAAAVTAPKIAAGIATGLLSGLTLSNGSDATNDIDIAAGVARDGTDADTMAFAASLTKRLDAAWAVGTGNGGLDTGAIANTTYHVWLIKRSDTGIVDALFSASASAPTMPASYDLKRRIGSIIRSAGAIVAFTQNGDEFLRKVPIHVIDTNPGTSGVLSALSVPLGIKVDAIVSMIMFADNAFNSTSYMLVTSPDQTDTAASSSLYDLSVFSLSAGNVNGHAASQMRVRTDTSARIRYRVSASGADLAVRTTTHGWIDTRGRLG